MTYSTIMMLFAPRGFLIGKFCNSADMCLNRRSLSVVEQQKIYLEDIEFLVTPPKIFLLEALLSS
jgi:hypothetical protein